MASGDVTPVLRRPDETLPLDLLPGEYCRRGVRWWIRTPDGNDTAWTPDQRWTVEEHDDGTITVKPSVDFTPNYHGFLDHGTWT